MRDWLDGLVVQGNLEEKLSDDEAADPVAIDSDEENIDASKRGPLPLNRQQLQNGQNRNPEPSAQKSGQRQVRALCLACYGMDDKDVQQSFQYCLRAFAVLHWRHCSKQNRQPKFQAGSADSSPAWHSMAGS